MGNVMANSCIDTRFYIHVLRHIIIDELTDQFFTESMIQSKYTIEVGQENNSDYQWVLSYKDPCESSNFWYGGGNMFTPKRSFKPVYVETPVVGDNIDEIRDHFGLNCIGYKNVLFIFFLLLLLFLFACCCFLIFVCLVFEVYGCNENQMIMILNIDNSSVIK